jgi:hypothetical protein
MPLTATFANDPKGFCDNHPILVVEPQADVAGVLAGAQTGQDNVIAAAVISFNVAPTHLKTSKKLELFYNNPPGTAMPCYFLPYLPNGATSMVLGGAAPFFFTSTLSGCTVQVIGPANAPTVTHGNARTTFAAHGAGTAQTTINGMLPPANGQAIGVVTRSDYHGKVTRNKFNRGKEAFPLGQGERIGSFHKTKTGTGSPEVGCFVFGVLKGGGNWKFYYQSTVGVHGTLKKGYLWKTTKSSILNEEIVLGQTTRFFP